MISDSTLLKLFDLLPKQAQFRLLQRRFPEPEIKLLPALTSRQKISLDIGAANGTYTAHLLSLSSAVMAFEPQPGLFDFAGLARALELPVRWETVALSDHDGESTLRIPSTSSGLATVENSNQFAEDEQLSIAEVVVTSRRLDEYHLRNIGFAKIDVEGHEMAVLRGAAETVEKNRCNFLVECEERHSPGALERLSSWMRARNYSAFFLLGNELRPFSDFDAKRHQRPEHLENRRAGWKRHGVYVNNFIFVPEENTAAFGADCIRLRFGFVR